MGEKSFPLVEAAFGWARAEAPQQPLTIGVWRPPTPFLNDEAKRAEQVMVERILELSDIISFHNYEAPDAVRRDVERLAARGRPLLCTEWLLRQGGNTFEVILPIFEEHAVGWYHWGLVAGRTQTYMPWGSKPGDPIPELWQHDVLLENGTPYRAGELERLSE